MIETTTATTITCDRCGRQIAEGEQWFQVTHLVSCGIFDGTAGNLTEHAGGVTQLCADDYNGDAAGAVAALTAPAPIITASLPPV